MSKINYTKIMALNPTVLDSMINSLGQEILFLEHPTKGDETFVLCACKELELYFYSDFFETDDMMADHKEYEPLFINGELQYGK